MAHTKCAIHYQQAHLTSLLQNMVNKIVNACLQATFYTSIHGTNSRMKIRIQGSSNSNHMSLTLSGIYLMTGAKKEDCLHTREKKTEWEKYYTAVHTWSSLRSLTCTQLWVPTKPKTCMNSKLRNDIDLGEWRGVNNEYVWEAKRVVTPGSAEVVAGAKPKGGETKSGEFLVSTWPIVPEDALVAKVSGSTSTLRLGALRKSCNASDDGNSVCLTSSIWLRPRKSRNMGWSFSAMSRLIVDSWAR